MRSLGAPQATREQARAGAGEALSKCAENGATCAYDNVNPGDLRAALDLQNRRELPIRLRMDINIGFFPELNKLGIYWGLGDDWLRICGLKFFVDGAISGATAAYQQFDEDRLWSSAEGKLADLAVLWDDILNVSPE